MFLFHKRRGFVDWVSDCYVSREGVRSCGGPISLPDEQIQRNAC
jgi:hypothetical protein